MRPRWRYLALEIVSWPDGAFDRILVGYGLRNLADLDAGLREARRVLRPGGEIFSLDFGHPPSNLLRRLYLKWLDLSTAAVGWLLHRDPESYLYIPESLRRFPGQPELAARLRNAGFDRCGYVNLLFGTMSILFGRRPEE
jgi:demethylmenaquinone methyltransferase/2-methoxy-6-polyprenyl-1,4-benzoquinol methylase